MPNNLLRRDFLARAATAGCLGAGFLADSDRVADAADPKPSSLTITKVETFALQHKLLIAIGPSVASSNMRETLLVKISTDSGLVGWGATDSRRTSTSLMRCRMKCGDCSRRAARSSGTSSSRHRRGRLRADGAGSMPVALDRVRMAPSLPTNG